jgi:putative hydrolase of the HAD superfamily
VPDLTGVLFDMGGVVMDSPLHAIARYERERGLLPSSINRAIAAAGEAGAWARLERGELTVATFCAPFEADCRAHGVAVSGAAIMAAIADAGVARPMMLEAIRRLRAHRLRVGALTNNWIAEEEGTGMLAPYFDVFVESAVVGMRKPDPRIFEHACELLGVPPAETAFLDDIGLNLKAARELGMITVKVDDPNDALDELGTLVGLALR